MPSARFRLVPRIVAICGAVLAATTHASPADELQKIANEKFPAAMAKLHREAQHALGQPLVSVMDKTATAPSGDKHDFFTLSPYHWPDPKSPDGTPYVWRDGEVNPDANSDKYDRVRYFHMGSAVKCLALAYRLTGDDSYARRAAVQLRVYFLDSATAMRPNLQFCQYAPGREGRNQAGIIRGTQIVELVDAAHWLEASPHWTDEDQSAWRAWQRDYLEWLRESKLGNAERRSFNNHGTWYDVQVVTLAIECGQEEVAREVLESVGPRRIALQIARDGRQPFELARTKSWDYSLFNLEAFCRLAALADSMQIDLWHWQSEKSGGIRVALDYLLPFATGNNTWQGKQIKQFGTESLYPLLLQAADAYDEPRYAEAAGQLRDFNPAESIHALRTITSPGP